MSLIEKINDIKRFDHIISVLFRNECGFLLSSLRLKERLSLHERLDSRKFSESKITPVHVRKIFEELGGAFIKLAQFMSIRPDLIPEEYIKELEKLQDKVHPFPTEQAKAIIEQELKVRADDIFKDFSKEPIASASIAQVHKATLVTGEKVAVKVQRPRIKEIMERDIDLLNFFANLMGKHGLKIKGINPPAIIKEFTSWTEQELDFEQELENNVVFQYNFENDKHVVIPKVYSKFSSKRILTMQYLDGIEIHNIEEIHKKGYNIEKIMTIGFNSILKQVFIDGIFHADPHPSNVLVLDNDRIAFVDFGIVGRFDDLMKERATNLFMGIIKNDVKLIKETLMAMGVEDNFNILEAEIEHIIRPLQESEIKEIIISDVLSQLLSVVQKHQFKMSLDFILFSKCIVTLEGVALRYDPEFRITSKSQHFIKDLIKKRKSPKVILKKFIDTTSKLKDFTATIPEKTSLLLDRMKESQLSMRYIDQDMRTMISSLNKSSNRITMGLIITALIISSALTLDYDQIKIFDISALSLIGFAIAGILIVMVMISILMERRY